MKLFVVSSVFVSAIAVLAWTGVSSLGINEVDVATLLGSEYAGGTVQVRGKIAAIESEVPLRFTLASISSNTQRINVHSERTRPDSFEVGNNAMVRGEFDRAKNCFEAYRVTTQCPSRYNAADAYKEEKLRRELEGQADVVPVLSTLKIGVEPRGSGASDRAE